MLGELHPIFIKCGEMQIVIDLETESTDGQMRRKLGLVMRVHVTRLFTFQMVWKFFRIKKIDYNIIFTTAVIITIKLANICTIPNMINTNFSY